MVPPQMPASQRGIETLSPDGIDRIAPTRRPAGRIVMRQSWHHLLFLHWQVDADALRRLLPPELTLDTFDGTAYVGLVPFTMRGVRPIWSPPVRGLSDFHEVNVRTYVHYQGRDPGVWFFSLDAANAVAVRLARSLWRLPYHYAHMDLRDHRGSGGGIEYHSERLWPGPTPAACHLSYTPSTDTPRAAEPGTLEFFLAERYVLYSVGGGGTLYRGQVYHTPYPLQSARLETFQDSLVAAAGISTGTLDRPSLVHYAEGVTVDVYGLCRVGNRFGSTQNDV